MTIMSLPNRDVAPETLEDAYVAFIFYCNPSLPADCDTAALREAFRTPPKHGGKTFDPWTIFQLVKRFYANDIKTWTELIITLGVEPPDLSKDESSQKVTQYGVRVKKWMNSLHVKSFFEYLMGTPNDYWTNISRTMGHEARDGIAMEDDMALRALLPHLRPKRGRKRPGERELEAPMSARPRLSPSPGTDTINGSLPQWSHSRENGARPDEVRSAHPASSGPGEDAHGPYAQWPASAVTPTASPGFWDETSTPTSLGPRRRRGAKNVTSAWRKGPEDSGKMRGRPPVNRTPVEDSSFAFKSWQPADGTRTDTSMSPGVTPGNPPPAWQPPGAHMAPSTPRPILPAIPQDVNASATTDYTGNAPLPTGSAAHTSSGDRVYPESQRPPRPSISLQVPQRASGTVRLATPPPPRRPPPPPTPAVVVSEHDDMRQSTVQEPVGERTCAMGHNAPQANNNVPAQEHSSGWRDFAKQATDQYEGRSDPGSSELSVGSTADHYFFEKVEDRTNVDALINFFMRTTQDGQWFDCNGQPTGAPSMDESAAIVNSFLKGMFETATSSQAFLINLGALAGARSLMTTRPKYYRMPDGENCHNYRFEWEYRFAHIKGHFNMTQTVPWGMWRKSEPQQCPGTTVSAEEGGKGCAESGLSADEWKRKYEGLLGEIGSREKELADLRGRVMSSLRENLD